MNTRGSVRLGVLIGDQVSYESYGVVDNMSVPDILSNSFGDTEVKTISTENHTVTLKTGTVIPIHTDVPEEEPQSI